MRQPFFLLLWILLLLLGLTSCGSQGSSTGSAAAGIEYYLQALASKDAVQLVQASCAQWEEGSSVELDSFELVETKLDNLSCQETGEEGETKLVICQGKILTSYNGENQEVDLSANTYVAALEDGVWKMCGYR